MSGIRLKILIGYALLAIMLVSATWMTYSNTRSLSEVNRTSEQLVKRRDITDSLVCSLLTAANAERAILLGDASEWQRFDNAIATSAQKASRLRPMLADTAKRERLDTLLALLRAKRNNTLLVMAEIGKDRSGIYYSRKMEALRSGRDSIVIHPKTEERRERHATVYEIVKSRRGFFRRLGDAFRRQHSDTVGTTYIAQQEGADSVAHKVDIADSVASALAQIRREQQEASNQQHSMMAGRNRRLQLVSVMLASRTGQLLEDIQADEHEAMRQAVDKAVASRQRTIVRIAAFGLLAILSAAVLLAYILRDIRRERRDRQRIIEAKAETERLMQQRERLLLTITHDIKAPAASIAGFAELLGDCTERAKASGYINNIASSARHLQQLVSALLDYHLLESGKAELHTTSFSPAQLVGNTVEEMQPMARERQLTLKADIMADNGMTCRSDAFRIKQILTNLIGNALKYTDEGGVTVAVASSCGRLTLSVADTGRGMTDEEQRLIFNAFTRLPDATGREGVGLGLSITRELVQLLGGQISVASRKGHGSKFTVTLPGTVGTPAADISATDTPPYPSRQTDTQQAATPHPNTAMASNAATPTLDIVIVDDDRLQLQLLAELFGRLDGATFNIRTTVHAHEAVEMISRQKPQMLFTDIEMPEMSGSDMLRLVNGYDMAKVAMTAHEESIMPRLRREGFDACLFKPFSVQTLAATICQLTRMTILPKAADPLAPMLAFAGGDTEAERQIKDDLAKSLDEYAALLAGNADSGSIAKAAHKAMPLLEMLNPGQNEWLRPITPEHIADTPPSERCKTAARLKAELERIRAYTA